MDNEQAFNPNDLEEPAMNDREFTETPYEGDMADIDAQPPEEEERTGGNG